MGVEVKSCTNRRGHFWVPFGMTGSAVTCVHCGESAPEGTKISKRRPNFKTKVGECDNHEFETEESMTCVHCGEVFAPVARKPGYRERCDAQLADWVAGTSTHNAVDDECCPDFSCCGDQQTPQSEREAFAAASGRERESMLMGFLGRGIERSGLGGSVHIAGRKP